MRDTWRITESLTNTNPNFPPLAISGRTVTEIQEKVNAFADSLEHIFTTNSDADRTFTISTEQVARDFLEQPLTDRMRATDPSEIAWIVLGLTGYRI
jgi:dihydrofolate reductase